MIWLGFENNKRNKTAWLGRIPQWIGQCKFRTHSSFVNIFNFKVVDDASHVFRIILLLYFWLDTNTPPLLSRPLRSFPYRSGVLAVGTAISGRVYEMPITRLGTSKNVIRNRTIPKRLNVVFDGNNVLDFVSATRWSSYRDSYFSFRGDTENWQQQEMIE